MDRQLVFRQVFIDTQPLGEITTFFQEEDETSPSVTGMTEAVAVKWLLKNDSFQKMFFEKFFSHSEKICTYFECTSPFTVNNKMPGDIDLLMFDSERPHEAIAFECKRVKVMAVGRETPKVNNATKIINGVKQSNAYQSLGFSQTYLMIILLDDGRKMDTPNTFLRFGKSDEVDQIFDIPWNEKLHDDVGIIYVNVRVSQITKDYNLTVGIGLCIDRKANRLDQTFEMTNKIKSLCHL